MSSPRLISALRKKWKDYLNVNIHLSDQKNEKLDRFLDTFLHLKEKHEFKKCPEFDDLTSCGNILTSQFLRDVHRLCTECSLENEDVTPLIHYLLEGRGWKILWLIKLVGVKYIALENESFKDSRKLETSVQQLDVTNTTPWKYFSMPNVNSSDVESDEEEVLSEKCSFVQESVPKSLSFVQFCDCVIELLLKISLQDDRVKSKIILNQPISSDILTFALSMFESIYTDFSLTDWSPEDAYRIKQQLLSLIFTSSDVLANGMSVYSDKNSVVENLLALLGRNEGFLDEEKYFEEFSLLNFNVVCGCVILSCIMSAQCLASENYERLSDVAYFTLLQQIVIATNFTEYEKFCVGDPTISSKIENIICKVTETISKIKTRRATQWHAKECNRILHKRCDYKMYSYHHYDNFGSEKCSIANYVQVLLQIYEKSSNSSTHLFILSSLKKVGFCCCLKIDLIVTSLLSNLQTQPVFLRETVFNFIETCVLDQLVADDFPTRKICQFCGKKDVREKHLSEPIKNGFTMSESSNLYTNFLLSSEDSLFLHQLEKHILQLCLSEKLMVAREIFLNVICPIFFKTRDTEHLTLFCLRSFAHLLKHEDLADIFLQRGGLELLKIQLKNGIYGPLILRTINVLIMTETNKLIGYNDLADLISVQALEEIIVDQCATISSVFNDSEQGILNRLRIQQQLEYQNDIWSTSLFLMKKCKSYRDHVQNGNTCVIAYMAFTYLLKTMTKHFFSAVQSEEELLDGKFLKVAFTTLGILLSVCLHVSPFQIAENSSKQMIDQEKLVEEMEVFLRLCIEWPSEVVTSLLETLLNTAQGSFFNRKVLSKEIATTSVLCEEADMSELELDMSLRPAVSCFDRGYDADEESSDLIRGYLQTSLLDLFVVVAKQSITSEEFSLFINLFKLPDPPLNVLLVALRQLISDTNFEPNLFLHFPTPAETSSPDTPPDTQFISDDDSIEENLQNDYYGPNYMINSDTEMKAIQSEHIKRGMYSSLSKAACLLPVQETCAISFCSNFSVCLWLKTTADIKQSFNKRFYKSNFINKSLTDSSMDTSGVVTSYMSENGEILNSFFKTNQALHVFSIGHNHMLFEVWSLPSYESLVLRISTYDDGKYTIISESLGRSVLRLHDWQHMTVNYTCVQEDDDVFGRVTIIVDAHVTSETVKFELKTNRSYITAPINRILIGHTHENQLQNSYFLGSFILLKDVVLSRDLNLVLYVLGPNTTNYLTSFTKRDKISFPVQLLAKLISSGVSVPVVHQALKTDLSSLQEIIAIIYSPSKLDVVTQFLSEHDAKLVPIQCSSTNLKLQHANIIYSVLNQLGGVSLMLLLVCRVVECSSDEEIQAQALNLLLNFVGSNYINRQEFLDLNGPSLVAKLISTSRFCAKYMILKTVVNSCLSAPIIKCASILAKPIIIEKSQAVILDPEVLSATLRQWKTWEKYDFNVHKTFLLAIKELTSDLHPHHVFNRSQLSHNFVVNLLMSFKERYIEDRLTLPHDICRLLILIMGKIVAFPLEQNVLDSIYNFVLLAHPAANTNLSDDCHNFYFSLHPSARFRPISVASSTLTINKEETSTEYDGVSGEDSFDAVENGLPIDTFDIGKNHSKMPYKKLQDSPIFYEDYEVITEVFQNTFSLDNISTPEDHSDDWEVFTVDGSEKNCRISHDEPNSMIILCSGLLELLVEPIERSADICLSVIKPEHLLILANNNSNSIRTAVIKLLHSCLKQGTEEMKNSFLKMKGFVMLANQIRKHSSSVELVEATLSLLLDKNFTFDNCNGCEIGSLNTVQEESLVLVFALLPTTTNNTVLCHKLLNFMLEMLSIYPFMFHFTNKAFLEVMIQVIMNLLNSEPRTTAGVDSEEQHLLCDDIKKILDKIAICAIGGPHFKSLTDLTILLSYTEKQETKRQENRNRGMGNLSTKRINFNKIITRSTDFLIYSDDIENTSNYEKHFIRDLVQLHIQTVNIILAEPKKPLRNNKSGIFDIRNSTCLALLRLLVFLLSPSQPIEQRLFAVTVLVKEDRPHPILNMILRASKELRQRFWFYLRRLLVIQGDLINRSEKNDCEYLLDMVDRHYSLSPVTKEIEEKWSREDKMEKKHWLSLNEMEEDSILTQHDRLVRTVGDHARNVTKSMFITQNNLQRGLITNIKSLHNEIRQVRNLWEQITARLCHERAVWHFADCYPDTWQLCNTEGPLRERRRLQRSHLHLDPRFLLPSHQYKLEPARKKRPFSFLLEDDDLSFGCSALSDRFHADDKIRYSSACTIITPAHDVEGDILVGNICLYFLGEKEKVEYKSINTQMESKILYEWNFKEMREVVQRRYSLEDTAIEIFLLSGETYFLNFRSEKDRDTLYQQIITNSSLNLIKPPDLTVVTEFWRSGRMTNFEYLTHLNKFAGRSHNDLMQYPVFPFILSNYTTDSLNLMDPVNYRDLQRPVAIQDKRREKHYMETYQYWKNEKQKQDVLSDSRLMPVLGPFHYGSHYSNSMTVLYFLVRLPPYTGIFVKYQDSNFDIPDRSFHSVNTAWRLSSSESSTDMKELIPELFYLPELFINAEGFDMGIRQNGEKVDDVILPPWCMDNPRLFILIHRQALESEYVTEHLNEWIDLIFGYKQTGKAAVDGVNVYYPTTYYGFKKDHITDPIQMAAVKTMIRTLGQTPKQLFTSPHPMVLRSLMGDTKTYNKSHIPLVLPQIQGLQWGNYVGSPACDKFTLLWKNQENHVVTSFTTLNNNDVFGLADKCCVLYNVLVSKATVNAIISWKYYDGSVRVRTEQDQKPYCLLRKSLTDEVTCCATVPDSSYLYVGHESGLITRYKIEFKASKATISKLRPTCVYGHNAAITSLTICPMFGIMISASLDDTCILWDLNSLNYVRSIILGVPAKYVSISKTTGDIAIVCDSRNRFDLRLYTINCQLIGEISISDEIHSVCFSSAPEGSSVNSIATGMDNGEIHLWSTWDLRPVNVIKQDKFIQPVISLSYSADSQTLFASNCVGEVIALLNGDKKLYKPAGYKRFSM
uniref:BEACH-type PH domain-containing protein n=1 Tax=Strigamia maritima TaxID=126957 RepID=T1IQQ2_STRMM